MGLSRWGTSSIHRSIQLRLPPSGDRASGRVSGLTDLTLALLMRSRSCVASYSALKVSVTDVSVNLIATSVPVLFRIHNVSAVQAFAKSVQVSLRTAVRVAASMADGLVSALLHFCSLSRTFSHLDTLDNQWKYCIYPSLERGGLQLTLSHSS